MEIKEINDCALIYYQKQRLNRNRKFGKMSPIFTSELKEGS